MQPLNTFTNSAKKQTILTIHYRDELEKCLFIDKKKLTSIINGLYSSLVKQIIADSNDSTIGADNIMDLFHEQIKIISERNNTSPKITAYQIAKTVLAYTEFANTQEFSDFSRERAIVSSHALNAIGAVLHEDYFEVFNEVLKNETPSKDDLQELKTTFDKLDPEYIPPKIQPSWISQIASNLFAASRVTSETILEEGARVKEKFFFMTGSVSKFDPTEDLQHFTERNRRGSRPQY